MERVCVIGAGSSGIASCQVLAARGIAFSCYEKGSGVGGNWRYGNDNGMSAAYRSLHINTSRDLMSYRSYPMPRSLPDFPHHSQIAAYFDSYVDHFGLRERIAFRHEVVRVEPAAGGGWDVTVRDLDGGAERSERFAAVLVANGHHWKPRWPAYPGRFDGPVAHAHDYRTTEGYEDRDVLVVGFGNSAMDIAVETSRVSRMTYLSARRGGWVVPKYAKGRPLDQLAGPWFTRLPLRLQEALIMRLVLQKHGRPEDYGLPRPRHRLTQAHPTISEELLARIGHGRVTPKPDVERLEGDRVRFADGSVERVERIVLCTGYEIAFPFLDPGLVSTRENEVRLYRRVVHPDHDGLFFIGLVQPLGAIMPLAEAQSEWVADLLEGTATLPDRERMRREVEREQRALARRYVASPRHTIQVDFFPYLRALERERRRGRRRRGGRSVALGPGAGAREPVGAPA